jgi:hypothetical protein
VRRNKIYGLPDEAASKEAGMQDKTEFENKVGQAGYHPRLRSLIRLYRISVTFIEFPVPDTAAYSASKHAVYPITTCTCYILPLFIITTFFLEHSGALRAEFRSADQAIPFL